MDRRSSSSSVVIETKELFFRYDTTPVLERLSLTIHEGEWIGIIGPNGGGKTTLLRLLMGFLTPTEGEVRRKEGARIGYVPQVHRTDRDFPITVWDLVLLGALSEASPFRGYPAFYKQRAEELIERLGLTAHRLAPVGSLSGGLAQRALFARALVADPDLLFLDEPTAHVDGASAHLICSLLDSYKGKKTILLVTHDMKTIVERIDRVLCVDRTAHFSAPQSICAHVSMGLYP